MSFGAWFQRLKCVKSTKLLNNYVHITIIMSLRAASNGLLASKVHNYNYAETKLIICNYVHIISNFVF